MTGGVYIYRGWGSSGPNLKKWKSDVQIIEQYRRVGLRMHSGGRRGSGVLGFVNRCLYLQGHK